MEPEGREKDNEPRESKLVPFPREPKSIAIDPERRAAIIARLQSAQARTDAALAEYQEILESILREYGD